MRHPVKAVLVVASLCLMLHSVPAAVAAVPVEDMSTSDASSFPVTPQPVLPEDLANNPQRPAAVGGGYPGYESDAAGVSPKPGKNAQLFYELQLLQSEVLKLRGQVEDQAYQIRRLQELQRSQYLDIDRRLTGQAGQPTRDGLSIESAQEAAAVSTSTSRQAPEQEQERQREQTARPTVTRPVPIVQTATAQPMAEEPPESDRTADTDNSQSPAAEASGTPALLEPAQLEPALLEKEAYTRAFELMKDQQFEQSIAAFEEVAANFPDGSYVPESRYWLGELFLMADRLEDARSAFSEVVDRFPAHQKVPLSLYKLGVVNHRLGGMRQALVYLDDVVVRYPDTPAAGLARTYAEELR